MVGISPPPRQVVARWRPDVPVVIVDDMETTLTPRRDPAPIPLARADGHRPHGVAARTRAATKFYGRGDTKVHALDGVDVEFAAGCFTAIMGPSGSGKSTLMHCLAGLDTLTDGQAFIGDVDLGSLSDAELTRLRRDCVGFIFQSFNLLPMLNTLENITLPMDLAGVRPDREWLDTVISTVGLDDRLAHRPSELSVDLTRCADQRSIGCWLVRIERRFAADAHSHAAHRCRTIAGSPPQLQRSHDQGPFR